MTTIINSTITLKLATVKGVTLKHAESLLKKMLKESAVRQNAAVKANLLVDCTDFTFYSSAAARALALPIPRSPERLAGSRTDEMDRSEVYRILGAYQKRLALAQYLRSTKWLASFDDCKEALGWVDYQFYKNVLRARKLPTVPSVKSAIIPLAKSDKSFCVLSHNDKTIILENFALWGCRVDLTFEIPAKLSYLHPKLSKITRPNIRLLDNEVVFDFVLRESINSEDAILNSTLGIDLGVEKLFAASRVYSDGRYSEEFIPSIFTDRQSKASIKLTNEIKLVSKKNKRRAALGLENSCAIAQELLLRKKRIRVNAAQDWSVAADIIAHSRSGEQITIENLKFNTGGALGVKRFRSGQMVNKLEHAARRKGKNVKRVRASYSSQECPLCETKVEPDSDRISNCDCGWSADRDYTASVVIGKRGLKQKKLSIKKNQPTPKRPRHSERARSLLPFKDIAWTAFTGATPSEETGVRLDSATSVIGFLPLSCSSKPPDLMVQ